MTHEALGYINLLMDELHETNTTIYELLVDGEHEELNKVLDLHIIKLTELKQSIQDE